MIAKRPVCRNQPWSPSWDTGSRTLTISQLLGSPSVVPLASAAGAGHSGTDAAAETSGPLTVSETRTRAQPGASSRERAPTRLPCCSPDWAVARTRLPVAQQQLRKGVRQLSRTSFRQWMGPVPSGPFLLTELCFWSYRNGSVSEAHPERRNTGVLWEFQSRFPGAARPCAEQERHPDQARLGPAGLGSSLGESLA